MAPAVASAPKAAVPHLLNGMFVRMLGHARGLFNQRMLNSAWQIPLCLKAICATGLPGDPPRKPLELWVAEVASGKARCLTTLGLSSVFDE